MTTNSGPQVGVAASSKGGHLHRAWRRGVVLCLLMVAVSFCFFMVSSPHRGRDSMFIHRQPDEYSDFLMPSNTSVPLSPSSPQSTSHAFQESEVITKGFLVHSPGCSIPDLDHMDPTIKRYIFKPKPIECKKPPSFTSSRGYTLYLDHDKLREAFPALQKIYVKALRAKKKSKKKAKSESKSTPTSDTTATTPVTITTTTKSPEEFNDSPSLSSPSNDSDKRKRRRRRRSAEVKISKEDVKCCYKGMYRVVQRRSKANGSADGRWRYTKTCSDLGNATEVTQHAAMVECRIGNIVVYKNFHYFFHRMKFHSPSQVAMSLHLQKVTSPPQETTETKLLEEVRVQTNTTKNNAEGPNALSIPTPADVMKRLEFAERLNVIIMGTDSASRLNMLRHLPKTYDYLTKTLGAVDMKGYNKVGDNTFPNIVALLGGVTRKEVDKAACVTKSKHYDDCHWVWKDFKQNDYVTAYMEDAPWMGAFHYLRRGFINQPTTYYSRPFMMASEKEIGGPEGTEFCQGDVLSIEVVQNYALEYARAFIDIPFFGFFWSASLTHDHINMLHYGDEPYLRTLQEMEEIGVFNNTVLFFVSDHGMRWGDIRSTYIGMLEERLPYVVVYFPQWFREKYHRAYDNLLRNSHHLTSNFDVYETLKDIAYGRFADLSYVTSKPSRTRRGTSLFRNIPWNRTCEEANIPSHFCSCQDTHELTEEDPHLASAAKHFLKSFNKKLEAYPQCEQFTKLKILSARVSVPNKELKPEKEKTELRTYLLQASLIPGNVEVEGLVRFTNHGKKFKVIGNVSRINKYGSTSACVQDDLLRKYCYCKDQKQAKEIFNQRIEQERGSEDKNNNNTKVSA